MQQSELIKSLTDLLEPIAESHGYELVAVEQSGGRHMPVIRVLLDREEGVDLEAITTANRWVSEAIDEADPINGPYTLEVSSPGVDRPLRKLSDFDRFSGETAAIKTAPGAGRGAWTGTLEGTDGTDVLLEVDGEQVRIAYGDITKARIKGAVDFGGKGDR